MFWICQECTTAYSVGASACPHCGSVDYVEEGVEVGVTPEVVESDSEEEQDG